MLITAFEPINQGTVLAKAVLRAAICLNLDDLQLALILNVPLTVIDQLKTNPFLDPKSSEGKVGILLIRLSEQLSLLTGNDSDWIDHFLNNYNHLIGSIPLSLLTTHTGILHVIQCVEGMSLQS